MRRTSAKHPWPAGPRPSAPCRYPYKNCTRGPLVRKNLLSLCLQPLLKIPGMISLGGGMPNPATFPLEGLSLQLKGHAQPLQLTAEETQEMLQYSATTGTLDRFRSCQWRRCCPPFALLLHLAQPEPRGTSWAARAVSSLRSWR